MRHYSFFALAAYVSLLGTSCVPTRHDPALVANDADSYVSVLPVVTVSMDRVDKVPITITNHTADPLAIWSERSGVRSVDVAISRDGVYLEHEGGLAFPPQWTGKPTYLSPGARQQFAVNLRAYRGLSPGTYLVRISLRNVEGHARPAQVPPSDFILVIEASSNPAVGSP